jgi:hypothetical protein
MSNLKNGKLPLSAKPAQEIDSRSVYSPDTLAVPKEVLQDMKEKGLVPKWINTKVLAAAQGYHPKGFEIYRPTEAVYKAKMNFGGSTDNVIRRGDLILGYISKEISDQRRAFIARKNKSANDTEKNTAAELRRLAAEGGVKTRIDEGYDDTE